MLDYRQYGAWYLHPRKWENRFQSLSDPKSIEIVKARRIPRGDKTANKQDVTTKKVQVTKFKKYIPGTPKSRCTLISLIAKEVGINMEGGIFWKKLVHNCNKRGMEGGKI